MKRTSKILIAAVAALILAAGAYVRADPAFIGLRRLILNRHASKQCPALDDGNNPARCLETNSSGELDGYFGGARQLPVLVSPSPSVTGHVPKWDNTKKVWVPGAESGGGGGMTVGDPITGADAQCVFFADDDSNLACNVGDFYFSNSTHTLGATNIEAFSISTTTIGTDGSNQHGLHSGTGQIMDVASQQTVSGEKDFADFKLFLQSPADPTAAGHYLLSGAGIGHQRSATYPDCSGNVAMSCAANTFSQAQTFSSDITVSGYIKGSPTISPAPTIVGFGYITRNEAAGLGDASTSSTSYGDIGDGASTGYSSASISVPATKTYTVFIDVSAYISAGSGYVHYQLLVDGSAPSQPTIASNVTYVSTNNWITHHWVVPVSLTSGSHTLKLQWKVDSGMTAATNAGSGYRSFMIQG